MVEEYEALLGSRINNGGELMIPGFKEDDEYEELWSYLMESIVIPSLRGREYFHWLGTWATRYGIKRGADNFYSGNYDPLRHNRPDELNTKQQLAIIKFFISKRRYSGY